MTLVTNAFPGGDSFSLVVRSESGGTLWSRKGSAAFLVLVVVLDEPGARPTFEEYDTCVEVAGTSATLLMSGHDTSASVHLPWEAAEVRTRLIPYGLGLEGTAVEVVELAPAGRLHSPIPLVRWAMGLSVSPLGFFVADAQQMSVYSSRLPNGNMLSRLTSSGDGQALLRAGTIVPVLGIPAWTYLLVELHPAAEGDRRFGDICVAPRPYAVSRPAQVFDAQALEHWDPTAGRPLPLSASDWFEMSATITPVTGSAALVTWRLQATGGADRPGNPIINPQMDLFS